MKRVSPECLPGIETVQFFGEPGAVEGGQQKELIIVVQRHMQRSQVCSRSLLPAVALSTI